MNFLIEQGIIESSLIIVSLSYIDNREDILAFIARSAIALSGILFIVLKNAKNLRPNPSYTKEILEFSERLSPKIRDFMVISTLLVLFFKPSFYIDILPISITLAFSYFICRHYSKKMSLFDGVSLGYILSVSLQKYWVLTVSELYEYRSFPFYNIWLSFLSISIYIVMHSYMKPPDHLFSFFFLLCADTLIIFSEFNFDIIRLFWGLETIYYNYVIVYWAVIVILGILVAQVMTFESSIAH